MTIKEYWNLIGRETFLVTTWEPDFSQACSFRRMLRNYKNFHYNDLIFLKIPKTMFLSHFWPFLVLFARWGFFSKNPALSRTTIYGPLTPCQVSEKTNEPILRKLTDRPKDEQKDGRSNWINTIIIKSHFVKKIIKIWDTENVEIKQTSSLKKKHSIST